MQRAVSISTISRAVSRASPGISVQPIGMLCVSPDGDVELINIGVKNPVDPMEQLSDIIDRSPEIIAKIKALFSKDKKDEGDNA